MSDFLDQFDKVPLSQKVILLIVLMAAIYVGYYFAFDQKLAEEIEAQKRSIRELSEKKAELQAGADDLERLEKEIDVLCVRQESFLEKLPPAEEVPALLQAINQQGSLTGLVVKSFELQEKEPGPNYTTIPVAMTLEGTYDEIADFFYYIGRQQRIVNVADIQISTKVWINPWSQQHGARGVTHDFANDRDEVGAPDLEVRCRLQTYFTDAAKAGGNEICKKDD